MSMNLSVYVGPYIQCENLDHEMIEDWEHIVIDGRGEAGVDESTTYLIPNVKIPGINRPMTFAKGCESIVMELNRQGHELVYFQLAATDFINAAAKSGATCSMRCGIVCGIF